MKFKVGDIVLVNCDAKSMPPNTLCKIDTICGQGYKLKYLNNKNAHFLFYDCELKLTNSQLIREKLGIK